MPNTLNIKSDCPNCNGTGISPNKKLVDGVQVPEGPCPTCESIGIITKLTIDFTEVQGDLDKILRRLKKIMDKLEVGE